MTLEWPQATVDEKVLLEIVEAVVTRKSLSTHMADSITTTAALATPLRRSRHQRPWPTDALENTDHRSTTESQHIHPS